jgi:hypothetical protein
MDKEVIKALGEIGKALRTIAAVLETGALVEGKKAGIAAREEKASKKAAPAAAVEDDDDIAVDTDDDDDFVTDAATDEPDDESFEAASDDDEDDDFTAPPPKKAKAEKAKKVTIAQVNEACKARAQAGGKKGRAEVLGILKKNFKTESISEIKPEQYGKVIDAMAVSQ